MYTTSFPVITDAATLGKTVEVLQERIRTKNDSIKEMSDAIFDNDAKHSKLVSDHEILTKQFNELVITNNDTLKALRDATETCKQVQAQNKELERALELSRINVKNLGNVENKTIEHLKTINTLKKDLEEQINNGKLSEIVIENLKVSNNEFATKLEASEKAETQMREKFDRWGFGINQLRRKNEVEKDYLVIKASKLEEEVKILTTSVQDLKKENEQLLEDNGAYDKKVADLSANIEIINRSKGGVDVELEEAREIIIARESGITRLKKMNKDLNDNRDRLLKEADQNQKLIENHAEYMRETQININQLASGNETLKAHNIEITKEKDLFRTMCQFLVNEIARLNA